MNLIRKQKIRFFFVHYIWILLFDFMANILSNSSNGELSLKDVSTYSFFTSVVIIAPIKETIYYQFIPKLILNRIGIENYKIVLFILGGYFSFLHNVHQTENILFSLFFTIGCFIMVNYYMQVQKREGTPSAVVKTIILHSLLNFTTLTVDTLFF